MNETIITNGIIILAVIGFVVFFLAKRRKTPENAKDLNKK